MQTRLGFAMHIGISVFTTGGDQPVLLDTHLTLTKTVAI